MRKKLFENPLTDSVAAVSVGLFQGRELLDLAYVEDKDAEVDSNVVMTGKGSSSKCRAPRRSDLLARSTPKASSPSLRKA